MRARLRPPPDDCAGCGYDLGGLDFTQVIRCPECGDPIAVRISHGVDAWMAWSLTLLLPTWALLFVSAVSLLVAATKEGPGLVGFAAVLIAIIAVSFAGVHVLVTRRLRRWGVVLAWLVAMLPVLMGVGGCLLGLVLA